MKVLSLKAAGVKRLESVAPSEIAGNRLGLQMQNYWTSQSYESCYET